VMSYLSARQLLHLGRCSTFLLSYTRNNKLWKRLCIFDLFPTKEDQLRLEHLRKSLLKLDWKDLYKSIYKEMFDHFSPVIGKIIPEKKIPNQWDL